MQGRGKLCLIQTSCHCHNTKWCAFSHVQNEVHCSVCTYVTWHPMSVPPTPHLICSVQGLLPSSPGASPSLGCLPLVSRLGCPGSTLGRSIMFFDCLLLFSKLGCLGSTHGRGISFPDCLLLFSRFGCPGSTPGRGISFPGCLLLFSRLGYPGNAHGSSIRLPSCLLRFGRLCHSGNTHASHVGIASCLLLFSCLPSPSLALT